MKNRFSRIMLCVGILFLVIAVAPVVVTAFGGYATAAIFNCFGSNDGLVCPLIDIRVGVIIFITSSIIGTALILLALKSN
jgi:predicted lysophospholipase L1 biosynthesis ABC-type transport system permease subunit